MRNLGVTLFLKSMHIHSEHRMFTYLSVIGTWCPMFGLICSYYCSIEIKYHHHHHPVVAEAA